MFPAWLRNNTRLTLNMHVYKKLTTTSDSDRSSMSENYPV